MDLIQQFVAVAAFQLGAHERFITQHVGHLQKVGELRWNDLSAPETLTGGASDFSHTLIVHAPLGHGLSLVPFIDFPSRRIDLPLLLSQEFASLRHRLRLDLRVCDGCAPGEHDVFLCRFFDGGGAVWGCFRFRYGLFLLTFPLLAQRFGDVD